MSWNREPSAFVALCMAPTTCTAIVRGSKIKLRCSHVFIGRGEVPEYRGRCRGSPALRVHHRWAAVLPPFGLYCCCKANALHEHCRGYSSHLVEPKLQMYRATLGRPAPKENRSCAMRHFMMQFCLSMSRQQGTSWRCVNLVKKHSVPTGFYAPRLSAIPLCL